MGEVEDLANDDTLEIGSVMTNTNMIEILAQYPENTPIVLAFIQDNGSISEHGLEFLAVVDNADEISNASVIGLVADPTDIPFHIPTVYPAVN